MMYKKKFGDNCVHYEKAAGDEGKGKEIARHPVTEDCPSEVPQIKAKLEGINERARERALGCAIASLNDDERKFPEHIRAHIACGLAEIYESWLTREPDSSHQYDEGYLDV